MSLLRLWLLHEMCLGDWISIRSSQLLIRTDDSHSRLVPVTSKWQFSFQTIMSADVGPDVRETHLFFLSLALAEARKSPPKSTNFCVGACIVASPSSTQFDSQNNNEDTLRQRTLVTGYTLECPGNTHAEQSCFIKLAASYSCTESNLGHYLPERDIVLYTTMEPCNKRSPGNVPCVDRILGLKRRDGGPAIQKVVVGVSEPETFVGVNDGKRRLQDAGIAVLHVGGLEEEILKVATAGHETCNSAQ